MIGAALRGRARAARALALLLPVAAAAAATRTLAARDPGCGVVPVVLRENAVVYALPHAFVRAGSDSAWLAGLPLRRGVDYALDPLRGELRLLRVPVPGETLWVACCWLLDPPPLELQLDHYRAPSAARVESAGVAAPPVTRPSTARDPTVAAPGTSLTLNGNKTVAVEFGSSQDATLRQSLDLTLSGTLAPGVELTGALSDRNTPLSAGGSTQDLQSLDRVLIELKAPTASAALGDLTLALDRGQFGRLERRLQGARAEWARGGAHAAAAAASAAGEYFRMQFFGIEGRQGPYTLTDRDGRTGISVVAGSEVVTVDGQRMSRGESADYSMDYERARITFSNRRPISSATRITVEYQYTLNRFRRNLAAVAASWEGRGRYLFSQVLTESDDRGRPLDVTLDALDRETLAAIGDSASQAVGSGVTGGGGDYDTVRVAGGGLAYAFAGSDSGQFSVQFAPVGAGRGDYAESTVVAGRTVYRFAGVSQGGFRVGRALPLPESHQLWALGGGARAGIAALEVEGAVSRRDLNSFSSRDDGDNAGGAGRASLALEGKLPGAAAGSAGLSLEARAVSPRFAPFSRLERPFAEEDWGLTPGADLDHQRRAEVSGWWKPGLGGRLGATLGRLSTPGGFASVRRTVDWSRDGRLATRASWQRAEGTQDGVRFGDAGRERWRGETRLNLPWIAPALRAESDERRFASDSGRVGDRFRELGADLESGAAVPWHANVGAARRRDARDTPAGFVDQSEARTVRLGVESPATGSLGVAVHLERRAILPLADPRRTRSDLASLRLRGERPALGLSGLFNLEITSEGENRRLRTLQFVGAGLGAYDALGNFVGIGDYNLVLTVSPDLERVARAAASSRLAWTFGHSDAWRGSRLGFDFESEARRRGELHAADALVSPGVSLTDPRLSRASVLQRLETELAPGAAAASIRMRAERRVSADRSFDDFAQTLDERTLTARWRARPGPAWTMESEGRLRRQEAEQVAGAARYGRVLDERGVNAQLVFGPDARLRAAATFDLSWIRPEGREGFTRTLKVGPDLGVSIGSHGRADLSARRSFVSGPPAVSLLPGAEPAGAPRWETTARLDYRVHETTTVGVSMNARERPGRDPIVTGRAELRAFF